AVSSSQCSESWQMASRTSDTKSNLLTKIEEIDVVKWRLGLFQCFRVEQRYRNVVQQNLWPLSLFGRTSGRVQYPIHGSNWWTVTGFGSILSVLAWEDAREREAGHRYATAIFERVSRTLRLSHAGSPAICACEILH